MRSSRLRLYVAGCVCVAAGAAGLRSAEESIASPDGAITVTVSDAGGLRYRAAMDGKPVLADSALGLDFDGGFALGPRAAIVKAVRRTHNGAWENRFGKRRVVRDSHNELEVVLREAGDVPRTFAVIVRVYDDGLALRYDLPLQPALKDFVITGERTEFAFSGDYRCWAGEYSNASESLYREQSLTRVSTDPAKPSVLPLLVEMPGVGYAAIAESDLVDWAGMFLTGKLGPSGDPPRVAVQVFLAPREDGRGAVVAGSRRVSPWRVVMLGRTAADLVGSDLIASLATPSQVDDTAWIQPGISAWDVWWTGVNPTLPQYDGLWARGDTHSHKRFIDFAAEMGWPYQTVDWFWYQNMTTYEYSLLRGPPEGEKPAADFTREAPHIDLRAVLAHARRRGVRLFIWAHSYDLERYGVDKGLKVFANLGFAGVKIDFLNSDSQPTVQWCWRVLETAARLRLLINFHGVYKPTGLSRTWPNYITQEGVLGNEYTKLDGRCTALHEIMLPFTRGLLGPMDFTPGGFLNRTKDQWRLTHPTEELGTRTRQLAQAVVYESPLLVMCDSPENYRGQPGIEFFRGLPTVWDDTVVLSAQVGEHIVIARRSGAWWYLAAINGEAQITLRVALGFLGPGGWTLRQWADTTASLQRPETLAEGVSTVRADATIEIVLAPIGGYAAVLQPRE